MNQQDKDRLRELAKTARYEFTKNVQDYGRIRPFFDACTPQAILSLLEENEALARDAARYRWLRFGDTDLLVPFHTEDGLPTGDAFDAAIDAAMQPKGE